jgi:hypothetical protein
MALKKNVFQIDNCERIVEILQKLLYNTRPLGPLQPRQYYSTRSASSSHKISGSAVKAILTDFYCNSILSIKNGNDNVRIEDNCLEEELPTTPILSEIRTLSLTFVMLMRFFARLNIYYKTFQTRMQCDTTPFTSCCHNVDFCMAFLRQSANNYRHCSFCAQISPVVLKNEQ